MFVIRKLVVLDELQQSTMEKQIAHTREHHSRFLLVVEGWLFFCTVFLLCSLQLSSCSKCFILLIWQCINWQCSILFLIMLRFSQHQIFPTMSVRVKLLPSRVQLAFCCSLLWQVWGHRGSLILAIHWRVTLTCWWSQKKWEIARQPVKCGIFKFVHARSNKTSTSAVDHLE